MTKDENAGSGRLEREEVEGNQASPFTIIRYDEADGVTSGNYKKDERQLEHIFSTHSQAMNQNSFKSNTNTPMKKNSQNSKKQQRWVNAAYD